jgi:hypothetical protein
MGGGGTSLLLHLSLIRSSGLFQFVINSEDMNPLDIRQKSSEVGPAHRRPYTSTEQHNTERSGHTLISRTEFEPAIPAFERYIP